MIAIIKDKINDECKHQNRHYQPETYKCDDCGKELWDEEVMTAEIRNLPEEEGSPLE
tara:strand:+ start:111 stop:281 length:171 start_codon:yes stop_codon:yes gene_type:complete